MHEKEIKSLEKYFKAVANSTRLKMLILLESSPGLNLNEITKHLGCNLKTSSEHLRKLNISGVVEKKANGRNVNHFLTKEGRAMTHIINNFNN